ncbi:U-box domain-containing protein 44 [Acorus calamus]|uniref:RING-type E3 ubiquitin transferase n=1 Tax=Acorus calamus TaxID=4465 RepID=A0AAV9FA33_ACOCL|nr:U-box domain-containing protein 44 [Acorus calamus]
MAESWDGSYDQGSQSEESFHEKYHLEPIYEAFVCPLTKQVMKDPVTLENGQTFERRAIENWFKECRDSGRRPICPLTLKELSTTELNPSIALRNTIEEWTARNEAAQLDIAHRSLVPGSSESNILQALDCIQHMCLKSRSNKHVVRNADLIPKIADMLKNSSRRVRFKTLETLRIVVEDDTDNKAVVAEGDTIRTIVKFLSNDVSQEREKAVSLLYELSKSESLCEKIGAVPGAILLLVGMTSNHSENVLAIERAEKTLENLEKCEKNVLQMAEIGRLQPLLTLLLEGSPETQLSMASYLGDLVLSNDVKVLVATKVGSSLVDIMRSGTKQAREVALKALNQISSYEASAHVLIEVGILPPLVGDLFTVGANQLSMKLKEVSANVLANIVSSGANMESIPVGPRNQTLVSEDIVHKLLHLISNTGPAIECKLLQVLVGLTSSSSTALSVVAAVKSSGAAISLIQFIEAPQRDLRVTSIKLLHNLSPYMGQELADALRGSVGQLGSLIKVIEEDDGTSEDQAAAISLLADLPERDLGLTRRFLEVGAFNLAVQRVYKIRHGETRGSRFVAPYIEGLTRVLARLTYVLAEREVTIFAQEHYIAMIFVDHLCMNGLDNVQMVSAAALENLSRESKRLTVVPDPPEPGFCLFSCFSKPPTITGLCPVHHGMCSLKETFCLLEGKAVGKLVGCLDHENVKVVEATLAALCTLLDDEVDIEQGVNVLCEADGIKPILEILLENRSEVLRQRSVWAVERILRSEDIAFEVSGNQNVGTALVEAYRHGDYRTKQVAEWALKRIDKLPNFSGIFQKMG